MLKDKNILVLSTITTYPIKSGGQVRSHHIIKELARYNNVRVFVPTARKSDLPKWKSFEIDCSNYKEIRYINYLLHTFTYICERFGLFGMSFILFGYILKHSDILKDEIRRADVMVLNFPHLGFLVQSENMDIYYISHNVEYELLSSNIGIKIGFLRNALISLLRKAELSLIKMSKKTFACTHKDIDIYMRDSGLDASKFSVLENGVDREKIHDISPMPEIYRGKDRKIVFTGSYFTPNIEAVAIIEHLAERYQEYNFFIVGSVAQGKESHGNVFYHADSTPRTCNTFVKYADYAINPVISGGGSNLKMIDYFYFGVPVIATQRGMRGFETYSELLLNEKNLDSLAEVVFDIDNHRDSYITRGKNLAESYFWDDLVENRLINAKD